MTSRASVSAAGSVPCQAFVRLLCDPLYVGGDCHGSSHWFGVCISAHIFLTPRIIFSALSDFVLLFKTCFTRNLILSPALFVIACSPALLDITI